MSMSKTETLAFRYLNEELGYQKDDIKFHQSSSPDFTIGDKGYEVKLVTKNTLRFEYRQWEYLLEHRDCDVLVYNNETLCAIIPMKEVPLGTKLWHTLRIYRAPSPNPRQMTRQQWRDSISKQRVSKILK